MRPKERRGLLQPEWLIYILFIAGLLTVSFFHEPWLDEAQAWQIGRCAGWEEIFFKIPHYEGHPPLWHIMLAIPAKMGCPYEIGLKAVALFAAAASGWILLFCAPFPRWMRMLLPFHYFFFYQYSIVARPYGYMGLLLLLEALNFHKKKEHPFRFVFLLCLECMLSAYGIVISGGIAVVWLFEIIDELIKERRIKTIWRDRRIAALILLLITAVLIIFQIMPREDTVIGTAGIGKHPVQAFCYTFLLMLPDSTLTVILNSEGILKYMEFSAATLITGSILGLLMLAGISLFATKRRLAYFWIPYLMLAVFSAVVYFSVHHMGIVLQVCVFWIWITWTENSEERLLYRISRKAGVGQKDLSILKYCGKGILAVCLAVPVFWSISASILEVTVPYHFGRSTAAFIREYGLDKAFVMAEWIGSAQISGRSDAEIYGNMNTNVMKTTVCILPYFQDNFIENMYMGSDDKGFILFRFPGICENKKTVYAWIDNGKPDVVIGEVDLDFLFGKGTDEEYIPVYRMLPLRINVWKYYSTGTDILEQPKYIYLRKDLLEQYQIEVSLQ